MAPGGPYVRAQCSAAELQQSHSCRRGFRQRREGAGGWNDLGHLKHAARGAPVGARRWLGGAEFDSPGGAAGKKSPAVRGFTRQVLNDRVNRCQLRPKSAKSRASRRVDTGINPPRFGNGANQLRSGKCRLRVTSRYSPMAIAQFAVAFRACVNRPSFSLSFWLQSVRSAHHRWLRISNLGRDNSSQEQQKTDKTDGYQKDSTSSTPRC
jgi:hypothetical protein